MKRLLVVCFACLFAGNTASATDWTGVHFGGHLGGTWGSVDYLHNETGGGIDDNINSDPSDISGGLQAGIQQQFGSIVAGVEVSYTFQDIDDPVLSPGRLDRNRTTLVGDMWTIAARLGYAQGPWLGYVKAGYASADLGFENVRLANGAVLGASDESASGYLLGIGMEYAMGGGFTLGAEYTYLNFDADDQQQFLNGVPVAAINQDIDADLHQLNVRLNYRFNWNGRHDSLK